MKQVHISLKLPKKPDLYVKEEKKHGPLDQNNGTYIVKTYDGKIYQRTLDKEGYIIHDFCIYDPDVD